MVEREMALVKLPVSLSLADVEALASSYNGKIVDADEDNVILMVSDEPKRIEGFLKAVKKFSPKEIVRGGIVAIEK
jgi:acetolactate synthase-1/3 small subunit